MFVLCSCFFGCVKFVFCLCNVCAMFFVRVDVCVHVCDLFVLCLCFCLCFVRVRFVFLFVFLCAFRLCFVCNHVCVFVCV